jgi:lipoprotein-anchoring transpeptidase ErfK/SrfK
MTERPDCKLPAGSERLAARRGWRLFVAVAAVVLIWLTPNEASAEVEHCNLAANPDVAACTAATHRLVAVREPRAEPSFLIAQVVSGSRVVMRSAPGGPVVTWLGSRTEFGSRRSLAVVVRRGHWIGVATPELSNGRLGWIDARGATLTYSRTVFRLEVDLSRRELLVHQGRRVMRRFTVSVGRPTSPTPIGRFAVTDTLSSARYGAVYGCCILALSGRQTHLPAGWTGGDRLAIHGSPSDAVGGATSAGCLHARKRDLHLLMRVVPSGTQVLIHP